MRHLARRSDQVDQDRASSQQAPWQCTLAQSPRTGLLCFAATESGAAPAQGVFQPTSRFEIVSSAPPHLAQSDRRRTQATRPSCPPLLVRQEDRKVNFVDNLVASSTHIVETIWPTSSVPCRREAGSAGVLPLRTFIQETLRRSKTSYSALQVALYYLVLIKSHVPHRDFTMEQPDDCYASRAIQCGRRMFLAALILSSKYLQDRNYSARAWSKISGLNVQEINQNEMAFLLAINWKLHITEEVYNRWIECVMRFTPSQPPSPGGSAAQRVYLSHGVHARSTGARLGTSANTSLDPSKSWVLYSCKSRHSPFLPRQLALHGILTRVDGFGHVPNLALFLHLIRFVFGKRAVVQGGRLPRVSTLVPPAILHCQGARPT
ncbi:hypothetical protein P8C59_009394 [Phyllachora maydis]|uniref:G1/S-specific cyclin pas1 n=1 Tax=Phyllachora maydis TaxID=1825666 RepID=A0AAD9ID40_9PEZI|nr:hypothetical protein P8C59_009394 [Phyllachora maydis]